MSSRVFSFKKLRFLKDNKILDKLVASGLGLAYSYGLTQKTKFLEKDFLIKKDFFERFLIFWVWSGYECARLVHSPLLLRLSINNHCLNVMVHKRLLFNKSIFIYIVKFWASQHSLSRNYFRLIKLNLLLLFQKLF